MQSIAYNQHEVLYIIKAERFVYHQCRALHIINVEHCISSSRREYPAQRADEIQRRLAAFDDVLRTLCVDDMPSLRLG